MVWVKCLGASLSVVGYRSLAPSYSCQPRYCWWLMNHASPMTPNHTMIHGEYCCLALHQSHCFGLQNNRAPLAPADAEYRLSSSMTLHLKFGTVQDSKWLYSFFSPFGAREGSKPQMISLLEHFFFCFFLRDFADEFWRILSSMCVNSELPHSRSGMPSRHGLESLDSFLSELGSL